MSLLLKISVIVLSLAYPFVIYWGLQHYDIKILLLLVLFFISIRWVSSDGIADRKVIIATLLAVGGISFIWGGQFGLKFYPVMMNLGFLVLFVSSLYSPMSIIERLARLKEPDLPEKAVAYTRKVTLLWSVFFLINGGIAAFTALWASDKVWMLYNGFIAYIMMGCLFAAEWLVRQRVKEH